MLNKNLGKYVSIESLIHDMNCVIKLVCTLLYAIFSFVSYDIYVNVIMFILLVILVLLSRVSLTLYLKPIWHMKWFLVFLFILNTIFGNLYMALLMIVKIVSVLTYTMMLLYTTKQKDIICGLQIIFSPLKVLKIPVNKMAFSIALAVRFIPDLLNTYMGLVKSQKNRGIKISKLDFKNKVSLLSETISAMFITSIRTSDSLADIMSIRMYDVDSMKIQKFHIGILDVLVLLVHVSSILLVIESVII